MELLPTQRAVLRALAALLGLGSALIQLLLWVRDAYHHDDPLLWVAVCMILACAAIIVVLLTRKSKSTSGIVELILQEASIYLSLEEYGYLANFTNWMIDNVVRSAWSTDVYDRISVSRFERRFDIVDGDITTTETYEWTTDRLGGVIDFPLVQMGSATVSLAEINAHAAEVVENEEFPRHVYVYRNTDRLLQLNVRLDRRVFSGSTNKLVYRDTWKNTILPKWDIVMVPHACYFKTAINEVSVGLSSNRPFKMVLFYIINIDTGALRELHATEQHIAGVHQRSVAISRPANRDLIFAIFERS